MRTVFNFTAYGSGTLSLTGNTIYVFDIYRKAGGSWVKLQPAGGAASISRKYPDIRINLAGEYVVVHDDQRQRCDIGATFVFTPDVHHPRTVPAVVPQLSNMPCDGLMQPDERIHYHGHVKHIGLEILEVAEGVPMLTLILDGIPQLHCAIPLRISYDNRGGVVALSLPIKGLNPLKAA